MDLPTEAEFLAGLEAVEHEDCLICHGPMSSPVRVPCEGKHQFCKECITEWLKQPGVDSCPMCRQRLFKTAANILDDLHVLTPEDMMARSLADEAEVQAMIVETEARLAEIEQAISFRDDTEVQAILSASEARIVAIEREEARVRDIARVLRFAFHCMFLLDLCCFLWIFFFRSAHPSAG